MSESLAISAGTKAEKYEELIPQIKALIAPETHLIANLSNIAAALFETFDWLWVGYYFKDKDQLVLGPFQGPIACTRIPIGKGVCGTCAHENKTIIVPDVNAFSGHIACSALTQSEIVIPVRNKNGDFELLIDIDSSQLNHFDATDQQYLEAIAQIISEQHYHA